MILIFGGTTEGRMAVDVCEQAGQPFYYSTRSSGQQIVLHHGQRLVGTMTADDIRHFCQKNAIRLLIDASHPFAEGLHQAIAASGMPVIRVERLPLTIGHSPLTICHDFDDAVVKLNENPPQRLLALTGVNTIAKLKAYWQQHDTIFRILPRPESLQQALAQGFPEQQLVYYNSEDTLPTVEQEKELMQRTGCDAIITKESGDSGGFKAKVEAALSLGLQLYVVAAPNYRVLFDNGAVLRTVNGRHGLRRAIEELLPSYFPLRTGLTTGAIATAAVKAATLALLGEPTDEVELHLPDDETIHVPIDHQEVGSDGVRPFAVATVTKDFSDDPDVTRGCQITAKVAPISTLEEGAIDTSANNAIEVPSGASSLRFLQGSGVGRVTLPGLGIPVGGPAINPVPRQMMEAEVRALTDAPLDITISVEGGRELAERTFNSRVGVVDGISIIGTSGIVSPLSNEAFIRSIGRELQVARAMGCNAIGLASGKRGETALLEREPTLRVIHYGNFVGDSLRQAHELGFTRVVLGIMIGKAVKLAEGHLDTHSHKVLMNKAFLIDVAHQVGVADAEELLAPVTMARELWTLLPPAFFARLHDLCIQHCRTVFPTGTLEINILEQ